MGRIGDLDDLKALPINQVAHALGIRLPPSGNGRCPLPNHPDRNPSFSLRAATNRFRCFGCGQSGSVIDLVMLMQGMEFREACKWLRERYSSNALRKPIPPKQRRMEKPIAARRFSEQPDPAIFRWLLDNAPLDATGRTYLNARGISDPTLAHFKVGQIGNRAKLLRSGVERFGISRLSRCGLVQNGRWGQTLVFPSGYILFPFFEKGEVVFLQARRADGQTRLRWVCPRRLLPPAFNLDALGADVSTVLICEGVTDVLSAYELGKTAIGVLGVNGSIEDRVLVALQAHNVLVLGDADKAGREFCKRTVELLANRGITAVMRTLPTGCNDINDYLRLQKGELA